MRSRWVVAAGVERVAPADSPGAFQRALDRSVFLHRLDEIAAARRVKAALLPDQRAQKNLIQPHHADQNSARQVDQKVPES